MSIAWKELYAITIVVNTWGILWQRRKILIHYDNQTVVSVWEKGSCKSPEIMALIRMLYFCAAHNNFNVCIQHISSIKNNIADALLSFSAPLIQKFGTKCQPTTRHHPCLVSASLHRRLLQSRYHGVTQSTRRTYVPIWDKCLLIVLLSL